MSFLEIDLKNTNTNHGIWYSEGVLFIVFTKDTEHLQAINLSQVNRAFSE